MTAWMYQARGVRVRLAPPLAASGLALLAVGCGSSSSGPVAGPTQSAATPTIPQSAPPTSLAPSATPPTSLALSQTTSGPCPAAISGHPLSAGIPHIKREVIYNYGTVGATRVWFLSVPGSTKTLQALRDSYDKQLMARGMHIEGTDAEAGHEAESEFHGAHSGTTNFRGLCTGRDSFRLKLTK